jgi:hypothetical protein
MAPRLPSAILAARTRIAFKCIALAILFAFTFELNLRIFVVVTPWGR